MEVRHFHIVVVVRMGYHCSQLGLSQCCSLGLSLYHLKQGILLSLALIRYHYCRIVAVMPVVIHRNLELTEGLEVIHKNQHHPLKWYWLEVLHKNRDHRFDRVGLGQLPGELQWQGLEQEGF